MALVFKSPFFSLPALQRSCWSSYILYEVIPKSSSWSQFCHLWTSILLIVRGIYISVQSFPPSPSCYPNYDSLWSKKSPELWSYFSFESALDVSSSQELRTGKNHKACPHRGSLWFEGDGHPTWDEIKEIPVVSGDSHTGHVLMWLKRWGY